MNKTEYFYPLNYTPDDFDLLKGDHVSVDTDRQAKKGDIVLTNRQSQGSFVDWFNNQENIIGVVTGRYRSLM